MSQGPSLYTVWLLWWRMWLLELPRCEGDCRQADKPCNCRKEPT